MCIRDSLEAEEARRKALLSDDIRQLVEELEDRVTAQEKEEENFDIEEELELAKAEGESVEEEIVDQFISEEELDDIVEEPEAVSYTHLDVYKRQHRESPIRVRSWWQCVRKQESL